MNTKYNLVTLLLCAGALSCTTAVHAIEDTPAQSQTQQSSVNSESGSAETDKSAGFSLSEKTMDFPEWPHRQVFSQDIPPPPPLGPYMSSALNNGAIDEPKFTGHVEKPPVNTDDSSMAMFSPDVPWPGDNSSSRWMPESGYQFVPPGFSPSKPVQIPHSMANRRSSQYFPVAPVTRSFAVPQSQNQWQRQRFSGPAGNNAYPGGMYRTGSGRFPVSRGGSNQPGPGMYSYQAQKHLPVQGTIHRRLPRSAQRMQPGYSPGIGVKQ